MRDARDLSAAKLGSSNNSARPACSVLRSAVTASIARCAALCIAFRLASDERTRPSVDAFAGRSPLSPPPSTTDPSPPCGSDAWS